MFQCSVLLDISGNSNTWGFFFCRIGACFLGNLHRVNNSFIPIPFVSGKCPCFLSKLIWAHRNICFCWGEKVHTFTGVLHCHFYHIPEQSYSTCSCFRLLQPLAHSPVIRYPSPPAGLVMLSSCFADTPSKSWCTPFRSKQHLSFVSAQRRWFHTMRFLLRVKAALGSSGRSELLAPGYTQLNE